ncbi:MAG TPA: ArsR family transcriptional regulator [Phycisphaerales bacterium]|nr:ArsR family transcriptional regulator [Phycisphaerales bacterium]
MQLMELDRIVHEPARLRIMMILSGVESADFGFLLSTLGLTNGNLSRHIEKLESAGFVKVNKTFKGRLPNTSYQLTKKGSRALTQYWENLDVIRRTGRV